MKSFLESSGQKYQSEVDKRSKWAGTLVVVRGALGLLIALSIYFLIRDNSLAYLYWLLPVMTVLFLFLVVFHGKVKAKLDFYMSLVSEIGFEKSFLETRKSDRDNGSTYAVPEHDFAHDLDLFGPASLFQYLNRCFTYFGKNRLAADMQEIPDRNVIISRQNAIKELSERPDFMMRFRATAALSSVEKARTEAVLAWLEEDGKSVSPLRKILSYVLPTLFVISVFLYVFTKDQLYYSTTILLFLANLANVASVGKEIKKVLAFSDEVEKNLKSFTRLISLCLNESFNSEELVSIKSSLMEEGGADLKLGKLSSIFNNLNTAANPMGLILVSGSLQFHLHAYHALINWKQKNGNLVRHWFERIGELESLISLGNFGAGNESFVFPELNEEKSIKIKAGGHPLLPESKRVTNDFALDADGFIILTGSNMAGKSTFLRTTGTHMVLTGLGAPICARAASLDPCHLLVSMGISDSLDDSQSYFFAEILRLKHILDTLRGQRCLILLDEILRGTNSEDKTAGTMAFIDQLIAASACGILATHDLEVCNMQKKYPDKIGNKHFASEVVHGQLYFDYKIKDGICQSRNAMYLLEKNGVIQTLIT